MNRPDRLAPVLAFAARTKRLRHWPAALLLIGLCGLLGCRNVSWPRLLRPGPAGWQQAQAVVYDPYTDNQVAPEVDGGRPRDYQKPLAEPVRAKLNSPPMFRPMFSH